LSSPAPPDDGRDDALRQLRARVRRLNALASGLVAGLLAGTGLFVATTWLILKGGHPLGAHLVLLSQYFPGYRVTVLGSLVGFAWAFVTAFVAAFLGAWLYNRIASRRESRRPNG
jgi:hypothetical protein